MSLKYRYLRSKTLFIWRSSRSLTADYLMRDGAAHITSVKTRRPGFKGSVSRGASFIGGRPCSRGKKTRDFLLHTAARQGTVGFRGGSVQAHPDRLPLWSGHSPAGLVASHSPQQSLARPQRQSCGSSSATARSSNFSRSGRRRQSSGEMRFARATSRSKIAACWRAKSRS